MVNNKYFIIVFLGLLNGVILYNAIVQQNNNGVMQLFGMRNSETVAFLFAIRNHHGYGGSRFSAYAFSKAAKIAECQEHDDCRKYSVNIIISEENDFLSTDKTLC